MSLIQLHSRSETRQRLTQRFLAGWSKLRCVQNDVCPEGGAGAEVWQWQKGSGIILWGPWISAWWWFTWWLRREGGKTRRDSGGVTPTLCCCRCCGDLGAGVLPNSNSHNGGQQMAWAKQLIWTPTKSHQWFNDHFSFSHYLYGHIINWHRIFHLWGGSCVNRRHVTETFSFRGGGQPLSVFMRWIIMLIISCFYDTPLSIKWAIMNAAPHPTPRQVFLLSLELQRADLHGRLIWWRSWYKAGQPPCGERLCVKSCSEDVQV